MGGTCKERGREDINQYFTPTQKEHILPIDEKQVHTAISNKKRDGIVCACDLEGDENTR